MIVPLTPFSFDKGDVVDFVRVAEIIVALTVLSVLQLCDATCIDEVYFSEATVPVTEGKKMENLLDFLSFLKFQ